MGFLRARQLIAGAVIALSLATAEPASAAVITLNATVDLSLANHATNALSAGDWFSNAAALPLSAPFNVSVGDTFNYNLRFAGDQALFLSDLFLITPYVFTPGYGQLSTMKMTGTMDLIGPGGVVVATGSKTSTEDKTPRIGQLWAADDFSLLPSSFTMIGFNYSGIVTNYGNTFQTRTYDGPSFYVGALTRFEIGSVTPVPEPSTWTMMLALLGVAAGATVRGRRRSA